jgi:lambda family phage minor tail protein L
MTIISDIQGLEPGAKITLYELDTTALGGDLRRFHGYRQQGSIFWQSHEYVPWSIEDAGFAKEGTNQQPTPTLRVGNVGVDGSGNPIAGVISSLCILLDDLVGAKLTRHFTLGAYLDAVNFPGGINPSADPTQEFPQEVWYVEQKTGESSEVVEFTLASALDFNGVQLPARQIINNSCSWLRMGGYRGQYCNYSGTNKFDVNNNVVTDPSLDVCNGTLTACNLRFGANNVVNFGSFPAAGLLGN